MNEQAPVTQEVKDSNNGVSRPKSGSKTGRIWEIADTLSTAKGAPAPRKEVLEAALAEDINLATAATQYGRWRKYHGLGDEPKSTPVPTSEVQDSNSVKIEENAA